MIYSLREIVSMLGRDTHDTIYCDTNENTLDFKMSTKDFFEWNEKEGELIKYKNSVKIMDFSHIEKVLPQVCGVKYADRDNMPYFCRSLEKIQEAILENQEIAVEGGPCLFGVNEVMAKVTMKDGSEQTFDYSTGKQYQKYKDNESGIEVNELAEFIENENANIVNIEFINNKKGITSQEYDSILYLFEFAKVLNARVVIPIPDMSYIKYLDAVTCVFDKNVKNDIIHSFESIAFEITDMYIAQIDKISKKYEKIKYDVVHARSKELCELFYEKRVPFIERKKILRTIVGAPQKIESVKDYISMPALPYYLYGITNIVQIDSIDETDSYRKCRKAHKKVLNLASILYPEKLSGDGINTIFHTSIEYKEYL